MARRKRGRKGRKNKNPQPSFDYAKIVKDAMEMQIATQQIMPMVREEIQKGWKQLPNAEASRSPKSWFTDPLTLQYSLGYKDRRHSLTYDTLKRIAGQLSLVSAIINLRSAQIAAFAQPYRFTRSLGYVIKHKDPEHATTTAEVAMIKEIEGFIQNCGRDEANPFSRTDRQDFDGFLRMIVRDSLLFDQACVEIVNDRIGIPYEFMAVDASTMRLASDDRYVGINSSFHERSGFVPGVPQRFAGLYEGHAYGRDELTTADGKPVKFVQVINGQIENVYNEDELAFGVRNPRTDIYIQGYGYGELEQLITIITSHLYAESYNKNFFSQGSAPKGMLNIKDENWTPEMLEDFQRMWQANVAGVENAWRMPVLQASAGLEWIDMNKTNREMEFNGWIEYLIKITCFPGDQTVLTESGAVPISSIVPGTKVFTHSGKLKDVVNLQKKRHTGKIAHIRSGGSVVKATLDHPFYVSRSIRDNTARIREFDEPKWTLAGDIVEGLDYLLVPKKTYSYEGSVDVIDLAEYVSNIKFSEDGERIAPKANNVTWVQRYLPLNESTAFALGLYVSEGNTTDAAAFFTFSAEEDHLVDCVAGLADILGIHSKRYSAKESTANIRLHSRVVANALGNLFGSKAIYKKVPQEIMNAPKNVQKAFISGVIAGDGSVPAFASGAVTMTLSSVSAELIEQMRELLLRQDVFSSRYQNLSVSGYKTARKQHRLDVMGLQSKKVSEWLSGVKGDRLRLRVENATQLKSHVYESPSYFMVPVTETWTSEYDDYVYNIEVEDEHTYQVDRFAVHNCGVFLVDPAELNFDMSGGVQQTPLFESSQEWKLKASKDRGLKPLLKFLSKLINKNIIDKIDDHFMLEFVGLDELSEQEKHEMLVEQLSAYKTLNEVRRELDLPDLPNGDIPMNPTYIQAMEAQNQQQQLEEGGEPGMEGEEPMGLPGEDPAIEDPGPQYADQAMMGDPNEEPE